MSVITRFPPSPTGQLHLGSARTALFNWLYARGRGGRFVVRIEDTDDKRNDNLAYESIMRGLEWLGLDFDGEVTFQSKRMERYREVISDLLADGRAYKCYCTIERLNQLRETQLAKKQKPKYDGKCRGKADQPNIPFIVRLLTPDEGTVAFVDLVQGEIVVDNQQLDDMVIARVDGSPTYHLASVTDDLDMNISTIIRGDDHLNNTPRQIHLLQAMRQPFPQYAHIPLVHGTDGKKLSKRQGGLGIEEFKRQGILPEAMVNYLARLGWSLGDQEIFKIPALIKTFDLKGVNKSSANFDHDKLLWVNQQHLAEMDIKELTSLIEKKIAKAGGNSNEHLRRVIELQKPRSKTLIELFDNCLYFFIAPEKYEEKASKKFLTQKHLPLMRLFYEDVSNLGLWSVDAVSAVFSDFCVRNEVKLGKIAPSVRVALTGGGASPDIAETLFLIGKEEVLVRLGNAMRSI